MKVYIDRNNMPVESIRFVNKYRLYSRLHLRSDGPPIGHDQINTIHANLFATSLFARWQHVINRPALSSANITHVRLLRTSQRIYLVPTAAVAEWLARRTLCAEGREFNPRPGQYSRMSFSSDQVTGTVFPHLNMPFLPNSKFI